MKRHAFIVAYCDLHARHLAAELLANRITWPQLLQGLSAKADEARWYWRTHTPARRRQLCGRDSQTPCFEPA